MKLALAFALLLCLAVHSSALAKQQLKFTYTDSSCNNLENNNTPAAYYPDTCLYNTQQGYHSFKLESGSTTLYSSCSSSCTLCKDSQVIQSYSCFEYDNQYIMSQSELSASNSQAWTAYDGNYIVYGSYQINGGTIYLNSQQTSGFYNVYSYMDTAFYSQTSCSNFASSDITNMYNYLVGALNGRYKIVAKITNGASQYIPSGQFCSRDYSLSCYWGSYTTYYRIIVTADPDGSC